MIDFTFILSNQRSVVVSYTYIFPNSQRVLVHLNDASVLSIGYRLALTR